jgi:hypothetical protein
MRRCLFALALGTIACVATSAAAVPIALGIFLFDSTLFGDSVSASDGGAHVSRLWLNVANAPPGGPTHLTAPNFDTGVANIGLLGSGSLLLTVGYGTGIVNRSGADLGVVVARFSSDAFRMAASTDGGGTFGSFVTIAPATATATGATRSYFSGVNNGPFDASLFVHAIDLSSLGVALGDTVDAVRIGVVLGSQLDLIRVAGFAVPEPGGALLLALAVIAIGGTARGRRSAQARSARSPISFA